MEWWLIPIGMFLKNFGSKLPAVAETVPFYLYSVMFFIQLTRRKDPFGQIVFDKKIVTVTLVGIMSQLIMIVYSYSITDRPEFTSGLLTGPLNLFLLIYVIFMTYYLVAFIIDTPQKIRNVLQSVIITLIAFMVIVLIPQVIGTFTDKIDAYLNFIGKFSAIHKRRADFYYRGSYITTLRRVNGWSREASYFAAQVGIIFIPIIISACKFKYKFFKKQLAWINWFVLVCCFLVLFFAKTSTGFLVIGLSIILIYLGATAELRKQYFRAGLFVLLIVVMLYIGSGMFRGILNNYIFQKQGTSNRLGGTIALFITFLHYPVTGIADGYGSYYTFLYVPKSTMDNAEFRDVYSKTGYPPLSIWGEFLSGYGLIILVPILVYVYHKIKLTTAIQNALLNSTISQGNKQTYYLVIDAFKNTLFMTAALLMFTLSWTDSIYFIVFAFYFVVINRLKKELNL